MKSGTRYPQSEGGRINRRGFLAAAGLAAAAVPVLAEEKGAAAAPPQGPQLSGPEFRDMAGAYAPIFTPYTKDGHVDTDRVGRMVEFLLAAGVRGFYTTGSTGESLLLTVEERKLVLEAAVKANRGRGKIIAHVGCVRTDDAVELARHAADHGADWTASIGPVFFGQTEEAAFRHYSRIAAAADRPFMIYNLYTALDPRAAARIFNECPNVKGMKYTGYDFFAVQQLKARIRKEAIFFVGHDPLLLSGLAMGDVFSGGIGTTYNLVPGLFVEVVRALRGGDAAAAARAQKKANRLVDILTSNGGGLSAWKAAMRRIGFDCGPCRGPIPPLTSDQESRLGRELDDFGLKPHMEN